MIKKYNQFIKENIELSNSSSRIYIDSDEAEMFTTEPALQKLVSDRKVSLLPPELWFESEDNETINILKKYFPDAEFNKEYIGEEEEEINEKQIDEFLDNGVNVNVFLTDLLSETNLILLMSNDELYERKAGDKSWTKYSSKEEFKSKTGASLDEEYAGNESPALLNLFDEVDDGRKYYIEKAYIDSQFDSPLLDSILKSFE